MIILKKKVIKYADKIIALTEWEKKELSKFIPEDKITIIPHPININEFQKYKKPKKKNDEIIIISVSGVARDRGLDIMAKIWNDIERKYKKIKWFIAGSILDKGVYEEIRKLTNNSKNVIFLGYLQKKDIINLFLKADIYVHPMTYACFGLSLIEAQVFGLPIVTGNKAAIPYVVSPDNFLIDVTDINQLKKALITLIEDEELRKKLGNSGKNYIKQFDYSVVRNKFIKLLGEL